MTHKLFIDSDVVIDFFTDRKSFSNFASEIFDLNEKGVVKLYMSAVSINNIYYIVRKFLGHQKTIEIIELLTEITEIVGTIKNEVFQALKSNFSDFEDAIQYSSALKIENVDAIITRNVKDYKNASIPIMTPMTFIELIQKGQI